MYVQTQAIRRFMDKIPVPCWDKTREKRLVVDSCFALVSDRNEMLKQRGGLDGEKSFRGRTVCPYQLPKCSQNSCNINNSSNVLDLKGRMIFFDLRKKQIHMA